MNSEADLLLLDGDKEMTVTHIGYEDRVLQ